MNEFIKQLKNDEIYFVLFNRENFHDYCITDGMLFNFYDFKIILLFFEDFYNFDLNLENNGDEFFISLGEKISEKIGFSLCGFYPKLNCNYSNIETEKKILNLQKKIIKEIIDNQVKNYIPDEKNKRIICFHNGQGEFGDGIPLNPLTFNYKEIAILKQFCILYFNYNIDMAFHGNLKNCYEYLDDNMKSFFQKRIISSNYEDDILYSDNEYKMFCEREKQKLFDFMCTKILTVSTPINYN